jgi:tetratricopeptide (TPR) repeat protein
MEILHKKANEPPQPIAEIRPDVPAPVVALVDKAMARNPNDRPQSMAEFARLIREVELVLSVTPAPVLLPPPGPKVPFDESWGSQQSLAPPRRLRALARSWHWLVLAAATLVALALVVRGNARVPVRAGTDAAILADSSLVIAQPAPSLDSVDAASASDTQATSDVEEPVEEENQGIAEPAAAEENPKREASPRLKAVRSSTNVSQAETRKLLDDGRDFLRAQRFDEARAAFEQLLHAGKSRGPALVGLAKIAFQQHEYQEAVDRAREAVRAGAGAEARVVLGDAYFRLEKLTEARKAYEDALKLDPENRTARQNLDLVERRSN